MGTLSEFCLIDQVIISKNALKNLSSIPDYVQIKFASWIESIRENGIEITRKVPGYHDEPLKGERAGQRSIRLNRSYRAIYIIKEGVIHFIEVIEVNKHDY